MGKKETEVKQSARDTVPLIKQPIRVLFSYWRGKPTSQHGSLTRTAGQRIQSDRKYLEHVQRTVAYFFFLLCFILEKVSIVHRERPNS
jgi:hypothetical protein